MKKIITTLLCTALILCLYVACSSTPKEQEPTVRTITLLEASGVNVIGTFEIPTSYITWGEVGTVVINQDYSLKATPSEEVKVNDSFNIIYLGDSGGTGVEIKGTTPIKDESSITICLYVKP